MRHSIRWYMIFGGQLLSVPTFIAKQEGASSVDPLLVMGLVSSILGFAYLLISDLKSGGLEVDASTQSAHPHDLPLLARGLLKLIFSEQDRENTIGDLLEEQLQFSSKIQAHLWLYKQIIKSAPPIIYKNIKGRLASYFGERVR